MEVSRPKIFDVCLKGPTGLKTVPKRSRMSHPTFTDGLLADRTRLDTKTGRETDRM